MVVASPAPLAALPIEFVGSFPDPLHRLEPPRAEFALIGRSNVGKSSLLNALVGQRGLARVSGTPGKTQLLNVYRLPTFYLIDLPGYGFARASQSARHEYRRLLEQLLRERRTLTGVIWLLDIRHPLSRDDGEFQDLLAAADRAVLPVLTKADKITRSKRQDAVQQRARELGVAADAIQAVSAHDGDGLNDLTESLLSAAREAGCD